MASAPSEKVHRPHMGEAWFRSSPEPTLTCAVSGFYGDESEKRTNHQHKIVELRPRPNNPQTHSKKQLEQIASSIQRFGFTNPVLIGAEGRIIAGHGRVEAARMIGMEEVTILCLADVSGADFRAYAIAENRLTERRVRSGAARA